MVSVLLNGEMYEVEPAVKAYIDELRAENAELRTENKKLVDDIKWNSEYCRLKGKI
jgi:cell division protein FtsB